MNQTPPKDLSRYAAWAVWAWLCAVLALDVAYNDWWNLAAVAREALARLDGEEFHPEVAIQHLKALGFALAFAIASFGLGAPFAGYLLGASHRRRERWFAGLLLGAMGLGLIMFALGMAGIWGKMTAPALLIGLGLQASINLFRERKGLRSDILGFIRATRPADWLVLCAAATVGILLTLYALSPPLQSDALRYHLAAPAEWIKAGRITHLPAMAFSHFPFLVEMNFTIALLLSTPIGAKLIHFFYLGMACAALALIAERAAGHKSDQAQRRRGPHAGVLAAALLLTHPVAGLLGTWAFVDLASLAYLLGMIWALMRYAENPGPRGLALAAAFAGGAFACKYTNLAPAGVGALIAAAIAARRSAPAERAQASFLAFMRFGLLSVLICAPWLARNYVTTGNPVYPLAYSVFGGAGWSEDNAAFYMSKASYKGSATALRDAKLADAEAREKPPPESLLRSPADHETALAKLWRVAMAPWNTYRWPAAFEYFPQGPLFLFMAPLGLAAALLALRRRTAESAWMVGGFAAMLYGLWIFTYQSNRFLLPVPALLMAILAAWAAGPGRRDAFRSAALCAAGILLLCQAGRIVQYTLAADPYQSLRYTLGREDESEYLGRRLYYYDAARWLAENWPAGEKIFLAGEHRAYYFQNPILAADWFDTPAPLQLIRQAPSADAALDALLEAGASAIFFNFAEWMKGNYFESVQSHLDEAEQAGQLRESINRALALGPQAFAPAPPPLGQGGSNYDFFFQRFNAEEWKVWLELADSPRLETVYSPHPLIRVCRILPRNDP